MKAKLQTVIHRKGKQNAGDSSVTFRQRIGFPRRAEQQSHNRTRWGLYVQQLLMAL